MAEEILKLESITKIYDNGIIANKDINFSVRAGEIHAIVGENGAGKSTLMKMIFGMEQPTSGNYFLHGKLVKIKNVLDAIAQGIGMVHQHFMLVESMDVVDNVMLGIEPVNGLFLDYNKAKMLVKDIADKYGFDLDLSVPVSQLSIGMKQKVEITKALVRGANILIFDEPTAVLTPQETQELFIQLKYLAKNGNTIIFISHKLNEVKEISDRITIIRKGETKGTYNTDNVSLQDIANLMVGEKLDTSIVLEDVKKENVILKVDNLTLKHGNNLKLNNINFEIHGGEILGVVGVEGNGQNELVSILTKLENAYSGSVEIFNQNLTKLNLKEMRKKGLGYIPEDRMSVGVAKDDTIINNLLSTRYYETQFSNGHFLNFNYIQQYADEIIEKFKIKCKNNQHIIGYLSGGNIQKVVVGRECYNNPKLLICNQPTRGVDLGAAKVIHEKILELRKNGSAILLISADLNELCKISDKCIVLFDGEIVAKISNPREVSLSILGEYMLGLRKEEALMV